MARYRSKNLEEPTTEDALQLTWYGWAEMSAFAKIDHKPGSPKFVLIDPVTGLVTKEDSGRIGLSIEGPTGTRLAREGDFIVRYEHGELDIVKPEVFLAAFEPIPEDEEC